MKILTLVFILALTCLSMNAQIEISCKPESAATQKAGSLGPIAGVGRWNCSAKNFTSRDFTLDEATFDLATPDLPDVQAARANDVVEVKVNKSKGAKTIKILGWLSAGAAFVGGIGGNLPPGVVSALAAGGVGADKAAGMIAPDVPKPDVFANLLTKGVLLNANGGTAKFTIYAGLIHSARTITVWLGADGMAMPAAPQLIAPVTPAKVSRALPTIKDSLTVQSEVAAPTGKQHLQVQLAVTNNPFEGTSADIMAGAHYESPTAIFAPPPHKTQSGD